MNIFKAVNTDTWFLKHFVVFCITSSLLMACDQDLFARISLDTSHLGGNCWKKRWQVQGKENTRANGIWMVDKIWSNYWLGIYFFNLLSRLNKKKFLIGLGGEISNNITRNMQNAKKLGSAQSNISFLSCYQCTRGYPTWWVNLKVILQNKKFRANPLKVKAVHGRRW